MLKKQFLFPLLAMILTFVGCSSQASKMHMFTLHASEYEPQANTPKIVGSIGIGPIILPESLGRSEVVLLGAEHQILTDHRYLWAGDLKKAISRVMASNVSAQLGKDDVWSFPWDVRTRPGTQVSLVIDQLGGQLGGTVEMKATWKVLSDEGENLKSVGRCEFRQKALKNSYGGYVAAINALIDQCSLTVVNALARL